MNRQAQTADVQPVGEGALTGEVLLADGGPDGQFQLGVVRDLGESRDQIRAAAEVGEGHFQHALELQDRAGRRERQPGGNRVPRVPLDRRLDMLVDLSRRWLFEVWNAGNYAAADDLLDEHLLDHNAYPGQPAGRAGDVWAADMVRTAFPDLAFTLDVAFESGDLVTGRWTMTGTHTGPMAMPGVPATGRPVTMTGQEIFRAAGGRFVEVWHQEDLPGMLSQLGLQPPAPIIRLAARRSARRHRRAQRRT